MLKLKKLLVLSKVLIICNFCYGQQSTLKVSYREKNLTPAADLAKIDDPVIKKMVKEKLGNEENYILYSRNGISRYGKKVSNKEQSNVLLMGSEYIIYRDRIKRKSIMETQFLSRTFLIKDSLKDIEWTLLSDTLRIGGYLCKKAIKQIPVIKSTTSAKEDPKKITAWFTSEIPISEGPKTYFGLPGLILKVEVPGRVITAHKVSFIKGDIPIEPPKKGKPITAEKFQALQREKMEELMSQKGKKGIKIIKMN